MRAFYIEKRLREKFEDWLSSIEDTELRKELREGTIITGGAIVSMLMTQWSNDYDCTSRPRSDHEGGRVLHRPSEKPHEHRCASAAWTGLPTSRSSPRPGPG